MLKEKAAHQFPKHSAGAAMTTAVPTVSATKTVGDIHAELLKRAYEFETINYIYVLDEANKLVGVLSIKVVFFHDKQTAVNELMETKVVSVRAHSHQERVALLAVHHNLKALPVVDHDNTFLGVVPSDTILNILDSESIEDILKGVGVVVKKGAARDTLSGTIGVQIYRRLPWLLFGLLGGMMAAVVVRFFEDALTTQVLLAAFIPTVVYMADAVGSQAQTIFIRSLVLDHEIKIGRYIRRELLVGLLLAVVLGVVVALIALLWLGSPIIGFILAASLAATIIAASLIAVLLPWLFTKVKVDPAAASGPFATIIRDLLSLLIYFGIAQLVLSIYV